MSHVTVEEPDRALDQQFVPISRSQDFSGVRIGKDEDMEMLDNKQESCQLGINTKTDMSSAYCGRGQGYKYIYNEH